MYFMTTVINRGYKNGCSKGCWEHADNTNS